MSVCDFQEQVGSVPPSGMDRKSGGASSSTVDIQQIDGNLLYDPPVFPIAPGECSGSYFQCSSEVDAKYNQA
jgi:hypothetical protein